MTETFIDIALSTGGAVTALLLLVLMSRRAVTRHFGARVAYALWLLPALRLIMPTIPVPGSWNPSRWMPSLLQDKADPAPLYVGIYSPPLPLSDTPAPLIWADIWPTALVTIWGLGLILSAIWMIVRQRRYARGLMQLSVMPDAALSTEVARAVRISGLKRAPTIRVSLNNEGPMVSGLWRPVIILPGNFTARFSPQQRHLALLHELVHIRRGDLWTTSLMMVFRLVNWPNPLVHLAWPRFRADQEAACDAAVLRVTGEAARADYAQTLLTAAKTNPQTSGRASPMSGTGLTLSLHHPIKERLMTLGLSTTPRRGASRWGLAALLLTGAALTAPITLADGPPETAETKTSEKSIYLVRSEVSRDSEAGFEIRDDNGVKTFLRVAPDGTTETLTREELETDYDIDVDAMIAMKPPMPAQPPRIMGEPGLQSLTLPSAHALGTINIITSGDDKNESFEVEFKDGKRQVFRIEEDGTHTEISPDEITNAPGMGTIMIQGVKDFPNSEGFPNLDGKMEFHAITTNQDVRNLVSENGDVRNFILGASVDPSPALAEGRLQATQSMLESTDKIVADLRETAQGDAEKDLRDAVRELEKARKALDKARSAIEKSGDR